MKAASAAALALALAACSIPQTVHVMGRGSAPSGTAIIQTHGTGMGDITIPIGGRVYSGRWVYAPQGGAIGITTATAFIGGRSVAGTGTSVVGPTGGNGTVIVSAVGAPSIRCGFSYSEWTRTGIGDCLDDAGGTYDLQITP